MCIVRRVPIFEDLPRPLLYMTRPRRINEAQQKSHDAAEAAAAVGREGLLGAQKVKWFAAKGFPATAGFSHSQVGIIHP